MRSIPRSLIRSYVRQQRTVYTGFTTHSGIFEQPTLGMLEQLMDAGKVLGLISNGDVNEFTGWQTSPLHQFFCCAVFSCDVGYVKPEQEIYELCVKRLGVKPADCLYVGDGGSDELRGAKACGMTTVITIRVIKDLWPEKIDGRRRYADHEIDAWDDFFTLP